MMESPSEAGAAQVSLSDLGRDILGLILQRVHVPNSSWSTATVRLVCHAWDTAYRLSVTSLRVFPDDCDPERVFSLYPQVEALEIAACCLVDDRGQDASQSSGTWDLYLLPATEKIIVKLLSLHPVKNLVLNKVPKFSSKWTETQMMLLESFQLSGAAPQAISWKREELPKLASWLAKCSKLKKASFGSLSGRNNAENLIADAFCSLGTLEDVRCRFFTSECQERICKANSLTMVRSGKLIRNVAKLSPLLHLETLDLKQPLPENLRSLTLEMVSANDLLHLSALPCVQLTLERFQFTEFRSASPPMDQSAFNAAFDGLMTFLTAAKSLKHFNFFTIARVIGSMKATKDSAAVIESRAKRLFDSILEKRLKCDSVNFDFMTTKRCLLMGGATEKLYRWILPDLSAELVPIRRPRK